jgi:hypothetical protein
MASAVALSCVPTTISEEHFKMAEAVFLLSELYE